MVSLAMILPFQSLVVTIFTTSQFLFIFFQLRSQTLNLTHCICKTLYPLLLFFMTIIQDVFVQKTLSHSLSLSLTLALSLSLSL